MLPAEHPLNNQGEEYREEFYCPLRGVGYIRDQSDQQVCRGLYRRGDTLESDSDSLLRIVRREHRAAIRRFQ